MRSFIDLIESINYKHDTIDCIKQVAVLIAKIEKGKFSMSHIELTRFKNIEGSEGCVALDTILVELRNVYLPKIESSISELEDKYFINKKSTEEDKDYIAELKELLQNFQLLFTQQEWTEKGHWHHLLLSMKAIEKYKKPLPAAFVSFFKYATLPLVYYFEKK
jgi:hypothetical protein